jgi:hypothetical protein
MWRDEIQAWLLARNSTSVPNLFANVKYSGHPALWYLLLMPLTRISHSPTAMQALHLLIATSTMYVFTRYSPFSVVQKILFSFGYFPFYEYSSISRNYGLGVLLIFVFCGLFERRYTKFLIRRRASSTTFRFKLLSMDVHAKCEFAIRSGTSSPSFNFVAD